MRIKKINDDKVQIIITNQDLEERDFKKWELMPISPKAQEFFQDILDMAYKECGFELEDDSQLIVEAYPMSVDSFVVVMTKVRGTISPDQTSILLPGRNDTDGDEEEQFKADRDIRQVWCFPDLEICTRACARIEPDNIEASALYKYKEAYYLALVISAQAEYEVAALIGEYGDWVPNDEAFFKEYGTVIVPREAVVNMASLLK